MVEYGADTYDEAVARASALGGTVITDKVLMTRLWTIRETGASATSLNLGGKGVDPVVGWEDAAVDPLRLGLSARVRGARTALRLPYSLYGHFGDGCHARINFELRSASSRTGGAS